MSRERLTCHDAVSHEGVLAELGITLHEIESYGAGDL
jgi:hypothetical protein